MADEKELIPIPDGIPIGGDLLRLGSFKPPRNKAVPLMMEFGVNPETGPFLVSSTSGTMWVAPKIPKVRSAFRKVSPTTFFLEVVEATADMGRHAQWGNVHAMTSDGVLRALGHLRSYELPDPEFLVHPKFDWSRVGLPTDQVTDAGEDHRTLMGVPVVEADWLPPEYLVVVPQERDYVGFLLTAGDRCLGVVHNASRGIAICKV